jgi:hypothetical protein
VEKKKMMMMLKVHHKCCHLSSVTRVIASVSYTNLHHEVDEVIREVLQQNSGVLVEQNYVFRPRTGLGAMSV